MTMTEPEPVSQHKPHLSPIRGRRAIAVLTAAILMTAPSTAWTQTPWSGPVSRPGRGGFNNFPNDRLSGNWFRLEQGYDRNEQLRTRVRPDWGGIISDVGRLAQQAQQNRRQPRQPVYPQSQPVYQPIYRQPTVVRRSPVVTQPPVTKPVRNVLPQPKPKPVALQANTTSFALASERQLQTASLELDQHISDKVQELETEAVDQVSDALNQIDSQAFTDPQDKMRFEEAVEARDEKTIRELAAKYGIEQSKVDGLVSAVDSWQSVRDFGELVASGASADQVQEAMVKIGGQLQNNGNTSPDAILELQKTMYDISVASRAREAIDAAIAGSSNSSFPTGSCDVYTVPGLPGGCVVATADGQLIRGGDEYGYAEDVSLEDALGIAVPGSDPLADVAGEDAVQITEGVLIRNPEESGGSIHYTINGRRYSMDPKQSQRLTGGSKWTVAFDRGGDFGEKRYTLTEGTYAFRPTENGWELFKQSFSVTISNESNSTEFHYVVRNRQQKLAAGQKQTHVGEYPIVVSFDRGSGEEATHKLLVDGTYSVGLDSDKLRIDLFPADQAQVLARSERTQDTTARTWLNGSRRLIVPGKQTATWAFGRSSSPESAIPMAKISEDFEQNSIE